MNCKNYTINLAIEETINISPNINAFFTSITTVCYGEETFIDGRGSSSTTDYWSWDLNLDSIENANGDTINYTFPNSGWNVITLTTYNYLTTDTCVGYITDSIYMSNSEEKISLATNCLEQLKKLA